MYRVIVKVRPGKGKGVLEAVRAQQANGSCPQIKMIESAGFNQLRVVVDDAPMEEVLEAMKRLQKNLGVSDIFIEGFSVEAPE